MGQATPTIPGRESNKSSGSEFALAIENFHDIADPALLRSINFFVHHLPTKLILVVPGRQRIKLSRSSRSLARDKPLEYDSSQLRFIKPVSNGSALGIF